MDGLKSGFVIFFPFFHVKIEDLIRHKKLFVVEAANSTTKLGLRVFITGELNPTLIFYLK